MHHHYMSMGGAYSFAFEDYFDNNYTLLLDTFASYDLAELIDPFSYFDFYRNKQFMFVLTAGDEFMMPWNTHIFWKQLSIQANGLAYIR
jgi:PhoPQ-activated pathogenicity-related protein